jgi:hypothetical protein
MAIGSNTLGLLFKIGVDVSGVKDAFKEGFGQGAQQGIKDFEKTATSSFQKIGDSAKGISTGINQATTGIRELSSGQVGAGVTNLGKSLASLGPIIGTVAVAAAAAALAAYAAVKAFQAITSSAAEFGTRSKDAFNELQKNATAAGTPITALQRNISAGIVDALAKVKGASDGFMAKVIEESGPALIVLLKQITKLLVELQPVAKVIGDAMSLGFLYLAGAIHAADEELRLFVTDWKTLLLAIVGGPVLFTAFLIKGFNDAKAAMKDLVVPTAPFDAKKTAKDLTDAQLEVNNATRELALQREKAAAAEAEINRELKAGAITADEALGRRLAILATTRLFELALFDAEKNRIEEDVKGAKRQEDALAELKNKKDIAAIEDAERQKAISAQQDKDQTKITEAALDQLDQILEKNKDINKVIEARAKISPPGAPVGVEGQVPAIEPEVKLPKPVGGFFDDLQKSLEASISTFTTWGDLVGKILGQFAQATEQAFAAFILTGKLSGQIFKQLVAQIIASLAIESTVKAIFEFAEAAAAYAVGDIPGGIKHTAAGELYATVAVIAGAAGLAIGAAGGLGGGSKAAAGAGGFGGTQEAPGTVTINQGSPGTLGIQLLSSINGHLSNLSTASPGDVVTRGSEQNPVAIGQANNEAARRDGSVSREFLQISGLRTA